MTGVLRDILNTETALNYYAKNERDLSTSLFTATSGVGALLHGVTILTMNENIKKK